MKTPLAFLIFNRPEVTRRVFDRIREARPEKLLVAADGPRSGRAGEAVLCEEARAITEAVDWDCEVLRNYADVNLGCRERVSSGLTWVFEQVEEAIIIEDDCLPEMSFFPFCEELLARYRDDPSIMAINGSRFQRGTDHRFSYHFSRFTNFWGWATWRRAWERYAGAQDCWPAAKGEQLLAAVADHERAAAKLTKELDRVFSGELSSWGYQWLLACLIHGGLIVRPSVHLVRYLGATPDATHTRKGKGKGGITGLESGNLSFPLQHPSFVVADVRSDKDYLDAMYRLNFKGRVAESLMKVLRIG